MNNLINSLLNWFLRNPLAIILLIAVVLAFIFGGFNWYFSRKYDKSRIEYQEQSKVRDARINQLEGENAGMRKQIAELEPKALAYHAIVDSKIKVDEGLKDKIEKLTEEAANAESSANESVPCRIRADRLCALFRASDKNFNCTVIFAECAGQ